MNSLRFPLNWLAWGAALVLPACTPASLPASPPAGGAASSPAKASAGVCDAALSQGAVDKVPTPELAETARQQAGARTVRVIGHDEMVTKEFNATRLNLHLDARGRVARVYCG